MGNRHAAFLAMLVIACFSLPANAADRMRAGHWVGTTIVGTKTFPTSSCISQGEADAINGDAKSVKAYLEKIVPPEVCKITEVK